MASEIGIIGRCMRAKYVEPCRSLTYQVKARGIQRASITMPIARRVLDVRLVNFMVFLSVPEVTPDTSNTKQQRIYFL
jgi:hypothetical protein